MPVSFALFLCLKVYSSKCCISWAAWWGQRLFTPLLLYPFWERRQESTNWWPHVPAIPGNLWKSSPLLQDWCAVDVRQFRLRSGLVLFSPLRKGNSTQRLWLLQHMNTDGIAREPLQCISPVVLWANHTRHWFLQYQFTRLAGLDEETHISWGIPGSLKAKIFWKFTEVVIFSALGFREACVLLPVLRREVQLHAYKY